MKVGDLVQLNKHYAHRDRWAIITDSESSSTFCKIIFTDTGEEVDAIKSGLIVYSSLD